MTIELRNGQTLTHSALDQMKSRNRLTIQHKFAIIIIKRVPLKSLEVNKITTETFYCL